MIMPFCEKDISSVTYASKIRLVSTNSDKHMNIIGTEENRNSSSPAGKSYLSFTKDEICQIRDFLNEVYPPSPKPSYDICFTGGDGWRGNHSSYIVNKVYPFNATTELATFQNKADAEEFVKMKEKNV